MIEKDDELAEMQDGAGDAEEVKDENAEAAGIGSAVIDVTEANIGDYTIDDVVMPMVGHQVRIPTNADLAKIYADLL